MITRSYVLEICIYRYDEKLARYSDMEVITVLQGQRLDLLNQGEVNSAQRFAFALLGRTGRDLTLLCFELKCLFALGDQKMA
jgi:hypothetical protein